jgi:hypothetical protein
MENPLDKEKQALYIIVAEIGSMRENGDKKRIPPTGIFKLEFNIKTNTYQLKQVLSIDTLITNNVKTYFNEKLVLIETSSKSDSDFSDLNIISMESPWEKRSCLVHYSEVYFPIKMNGKTFLASYMYPDNADVPKAKLTDISSCNTRDVPLNLMNRIDGEYEWFTLRNKIYFSKMGMENISLPYDFPVKFGRNIKEMRMEKTNNDNIIVFAIRDKDKRITKIVWLYKKNSIWHEQLVKGDASIAKVFGSFITVRVGFLSSQKLQPPEMKDEWYLINSMDGNQQIITYQSYSNIIYADENFILVVNDHKLLYIPTEKNMLQHQNAKVIFSDEKKDIGTSKEMVNYMRDAFWGPK